MVFIIWGGELCTVQAYNVCATAWQDRKVFTVMYTGFNPLDETTVLQTQKNGSRFPVPCHTAIAALNAYMGGIDRGDQLRGYNIFKLKSRTYIFNSL